jgi:hypothetical protein
MVHKLPQRPVTNCNQAYLSVTINTLSGFDRFKALLLVLNGKKKSAKNACITNHEKAF